MRDADQDHNHHLALVTGATGAIGQRETGKYFEHMQMRRCRFGEDSEAVNALYEACMAY